MGGCMSKKDSEEREPEDLPPGPVGKDGRYQKPKWKSEEPMTKEQLETMRAVFWDTQPAYGGQKVIWDALKAAAETEDMESVKLILESAGIIVNTTDMTICYDERGAKYDLPRYVLSEPLNLLR
ncbi:ubiquitin domain-containing protein 2-like protein [Dunaliella salina]|uniref:Ubiquitin domain-containing protein 2-like protein n=1 Tax=Dunaliella salina TaxID=3046 RepID=A0ABQ7GKL2_DUNSA|nr:ubiquitin domain-containing protein 2-like protein [Dunaliella salina]|eukprot:KAF5835162.1 ubiquitin domain-containing protein 2-like protein [Dunaliella salina]